MNENKEHITRYSATAIQQYLQGKLSAAEMHALEKAALDDPFLADAIEGMDLAMKEHQESIIMGKLQEAKQEISNRTTKKSETAPVVAFRWWKVAAAAAVLVVGTIWVYNILGTQKEKTQDVAVVLPQASNEQKAKAETESNKADSTTAVPSMLNQVGPLPVPDSTTRHSGAIIIPEPATFATVEKEAKPVGENKEAVANGLAKTKEEDRFVRNFYTEKDTTIHIDLADGYDKKSVPAAPAAKQQAARKMEEITLQQDSYIKLDSIKTRAQLSGKVAGVDFENTKNLNYISGRVINENNMPLANASLYIQNYRSNYITDKAGMFKIPKDDTALDVSVAVTGYPTQRFVLQNNAVAYNQLQLQSQHNFFSENNLARERISAKRGEEQRKDKANDDEPEQLATVMAQEAEPVYGWLAYEKYLSENKRKPAGNTQTGDVVVSFQVGKKGELSDYKIEQSLSKTYDAEAMRLIKDGPRWKSLNNRKSRITIIVRF